MHIIVYNYPIFLQELNIFIISCAEQLKVRLVICKVKALYSNLCGRGRTNVEEERSCPFLKDNHYI